MIRQFPCFNLDAHASLYQLCVVVASMVWTTPVLAQQLSREVRLFESMDDGYSIVRFQADAAENIAGIRWLCGGKNPSLVLQASGGGRSTPVTGPAAQDELAKTPRPDLLSDRRIDFANGTRHDSLRGVLNQLVDQLKDLKPTNKEEVGVGFAPAPASKWFVYTRDGSTGTGRIRIAGIASTINFRSDRLSSGQAERFEKQCILILPSAASISELFLGSRGLAFLNSDRQTLSVRLKSDAANQILGGVVDAGGFHSFEISMLAAASQRDRDVPDLDLPQLDWEIAAAMVQAYDDTDRYHRRDPIIWIIGPSTKKL